MKKTLNNFFDEANSEEIEGLVKRNAAPEISADTLSSVKDKVYAKTNLKKENKPNQSVWLRFGAIAACFLLIVGAVIAVPMLWEDESGDFTEPEDTEGKSDIPIVNIQVPSSAPQYYGSESSGASSSGGEAAEIIPDGISVVAEFIDALPDTYTFFDDWKQTEFRLIRLRTLSLVTGTEMADEFYYVVPVGYMTDFSVYDSFVIYHMGQFGYDFSVLYNATKQCAESIDTVIFGYNVENYGFLGTHFMAFDSDDNIDLRLWSSTDAWSTMTKSWLGEYGSFTKKDAEAEALDWGCGAVDRYVHRLDGLSAEAKDLLEKLRAFESGIYAPSSTNKLWYGPDTGLSCRRYINGFATNETVILRNEGAPIRSKASFSEEETAALPDLPSAYATVKDYFENGAIIPPHIRNYGEMKNTVNGIFGWYAKTEEGVIGIVRVTWCYVSDEYDLCFDDAYYTVKYGSDECKAIDRDALLDMLGNYESTYIFSGEYDELGKVYDRGNIPVP